MRLISGCTSLGRGSLTAYRNRGSPQSAAKKMNKQETSGHFGDLAPFFAKAYIVVLWVEKISSDISLIIEVVVVVSAIPQIVQNIYQTVLVTHTFVHE